MHYGDHDELILEQPSQNIKNSVGATGQGMNSS